MDPLCEIRVRDDILRAYTAKRAGLDHESGWEFEIVRRESRSWQINSIKYDWNWLLTLKIANLARTTGFGIFLLQLT